MIILFYLLGNLKSFCLLRVPLIHIHLLSFTGLLQVFFALFTGTLGCIWFVFWMLLCYDSPAKHPRISPQERAFIENAIGATTKYKKVINAAFTAFVM